MEASQTVVVKKLRDGRMRVVIGCYAVAAILIVIRLAVLQLHHAHLFTALGERNFLKTEVLAPRRGNVLDCQGRVLATNRPVFDLLWVGCGNRHLSDEQKKLLSFIQNECGITCNETAIERAERNKKRFLIGEDVSLVLLSRLGEKFGDHPNLLQTNYPKRTYPHGRLACHVLGYLARAEKNARSHGVTGIEKMCQENLQGEPGFIQHVINSHGDRLSQRVTKEAQAGKDINLTLDFDLQQLGESLFDDSLSGALIVMDPEDGSIRALVSFPSYDPNKFLFPIPEQVWLEEFHKNSPLLNRAISAEYPPASLFKLVTFAAGLEEGLISSDGECHCPGYFKFAERKYFCMRHLGHGPLSMRDALAYSCNVPCFKIGHKMKIDQLAMYATRLGLGIPTGISLPEKAGLIPTGAWKKSAKGEPWWRGETLSVSIGQSYTSVTPLQMVRMIGAIFTGSLVRPRILVDDEIITEPVNLQRSTRRFLQDAMAAVSEEGTGLRLRKLRNDFTLYAKTGTAQTSSILKAEDKTSKNQFEHAWCGVHFTYKNHKSLCLITLIEHAGSSRDAIIYTERFLRGYAKLYQTPKSTQPEVIASTLPTP